MAEPIVMPKLAMAMKEGKIAEWKNKEGDWVEKGQIALAIETEKVSYELESPGSGFLHILVGPGRTVPVYETIALLAVDRAELAALQSGQPGPAVADALTPTAASATGSVPETTRERVKITPAARKMALDQNLDYTRLTGTGPGGRIEKADILAALEPGPPSPTPSGSTDTPETGEVIDGKRVKAVIPLTGVRKAIADHMIHSLAISAQLTSVIEVDMTEMKRLRMALVAKEAALGIKITYTDLMVMALAKAVQAVPIINSSLIGVEIKIWDDINVGLAVAYDRGGFDSGLIVPVIRNADRKSLVELAQAGRDLTKRAREGRLGLDDLQGGTITLSNFGAFSDRWGLATPIINQPQAVIIGAGAMVDRPVAWAGQVVVRPIMTISITFDHRILDGLPIGRFAAALADRMENPALMLA